MKKIVKTKYDGYDLEIIFTQGFFGRLIELVYGRLNVSQKKKNKGFEEYESYNDFYYFTINTFTGSISTGIGTNFNNEGAEEVSKIIRKSWLKIRKEFAKEKGAKN